MNPSKIHLWGGMVGVRFQAQDEVESHLEKVLQVSGGVAHPAAIQILPGVPELFWLVLLGVCWEVQLGCLEPHSEALVESLLMGW